AMSAGTLLSFCNSADSGYRRICSIYIMGVFQGLGLAAGKLNDKEHFCFPDDMRESQLVAIFQKTANLLKQTFPIDMNEPAVSIVGAAMMHEFPCANQRPTRP